MSNADDNSGWAPIQPGTPIDGYLQPDTFMVPTMGGNLVPVFFPSQPFAYKEDVMMKMGPYPCAQNNNNNTNSKNMFFSAPTDNNPTVYNDSKVDRFIQSVLVDDVNNLKMENCGVRQEEVLSFFSEQFKVALDPQSSFTTLDQPVKSSKKKRRKSETKDMEPEIERELAKFPEAERDKQRKVLKNRLAARTFRRRQREHINDMSKQIDTMTAENSALKSALKMVVMENQMFREQLFYANSLLARNDSQPEEESSEEQLSQQQQVKEQPLDESSCRNKLLLGQESAACMFSRGPQLKQHPINQQYGRFGMNDPGMLQIGNSVVEQYSVIDGHMQSTLDSYFSEDL